MRNAIAIKHTDRERETERKTKAEQKKKNCFIDFLLKL